MIRVLFFQPVGKNHPCVLHVCAISTLSFKPTPRTTWHEPGLRKCPRQGYVSGLCVQYWLDNWFLFCKNPIGLCVRYLVPSSTQWFGGFVKIPLASSAALGSIISASVSFASLAKDLFGAAHQNCSISKTGQVTSACLFGNRPFSLD